MLGNEYNKLPGRKCTPLHTTTLPFTRGLLGPMDFTPGGFVNRTEKNFVQDVLRVLNRYEELRRIVAIVGVEELSGADRILFERAQKLQNFLTQPFFTAEVYTGKKGEYVPLEQTLEGCERIVAGQVDRVPPEKFYMVGALPASL